MGGKFCITNLFTFKNFGVVRIYRHRFIGTDRGNFTNGGNVYNFTFGMCGARRMTQFIISFCAGCILIGSLYLVCPEGNLSKPIKTVFSLAFLVIVISAANIPIKNISPHFTPSATLSQNYNDMQTAAAEYVFSKALKSQNINFSKITIYTNNSTPESIVISKVVIVSDETEEKILKALGELQNNREVEIINE